MPRTRPVRRAPMARAALASALTVAAALGATACSDDGDGDDATSTTALQVTTIELEVRDGSVLGGADRHEVPLGNTVTVVVIADTVEEAHVHGYDHLLDLAPDEPASVTFVADIPGVFEIELEGSGTKLAELQVS